MGSGSNRAISFSVKRSPSPFDDGPAAAAKVTRPSTEAPIGTPESAQCRLNHLQVVGKAWAVPDLFSQPRHRNTAGTG